MRIIVIAVFCLFLLATPVFAQNIGSSRLSPENPLYFLKPVRESLEIRFAGTEKVRVIKRLEFAERRLREVNSLIALHREDLVQPNLEKFLLEISLIRPVREKNLNPMVSDNLGHYMQVLVTFYSNLTDSKAKLGVRSTIYRFMELNKVYYTNMVPALTGQIYPPQVSKFALGCNLLSKESKDLSLNESERQVLKERGEKCERLLTLQ